MVRRPRTLLLALLLLVFAGSLVAACGGDDEAASQDVNTLLKETFAGGKKIDSGNLKLSIALDATGARQVQGPVDVSLSGPFQSAGEAKLPKFRMDLKFSGAGQNIEAGATSTGDKGFVSFQNQEYAVSDEVFRQFRTSFEQAQAKQRDKQGRNQSLASLGIDPRKWLRDPKNEGESKVGDDETIKITGGVDVPKLLDDVNRALRRAASLGGQSGRDLPDRLTDAQKRQVQDAVKALDVEIHTGREDKILRRMVVALDLEPRAEDRKGLERAKVRLDLSISDVNEDQDIEAPENPKSFDELARQLGGLGLGGLGGRGSGSGSGSDSGSGSGGASSEALEKYSNCIRRAGDDAQKAQKCADLLTP